VASLLPRERNGERTGRMFCIAVRDAEEINFKEYFLKKGPNR
jgi:hypothetical protein